MSPIDRECLNVDELESVRVRFEIYQSLKNYLCKNESDAIERFIDGKVIECAMKNRNEVQRCYDAYQISILNRHVVSIFHMFAEAE